MTLTPDETLAKDKNCKTLHKMILRDKFLELSRTLEEEISAVIEVNMKSWKEQNLPTGVVSWSPALPKSITNSVTVSRSKEKRVGGSLPSREFISRPSLLSELLSVSHFQSLYNLFVAILLILFIQEVVEEVAKTGRIDLKFSYFAWGFGKFDKVIEIWICMKTSTMIGIYLSFHYWAHHRPRSPRIYDATGSILFAIYLFLFLKLPTQSLLRNQLPPASSIVILCEQVRLFMKTWAFVRTNIPRALAYKKDDDSKEVKSPCPDFSQYLYFLFAPTLIYRDEYPRTSSCSWRKVTKDFAQVIGCILYTHFLMTRFYEPTFNNFGKEEFSLGKIMKAMFLSCFPASLILLSSFYLLLHAWLNAFSEILTFADRMFYKDWWNSTSYPRFYRTWNCVVHDWLYEYVYKECSEIQFCRRLKFVPMLVVFSMSSVVHEYIITFSFRFFYPVLLIMFGGFGVIFMFINTKKTIFNVFIWMSLILGAGIMMCLYTLEWYARINCPPTFDGITDYFVPRSWFCSTVSPHSSR